MNNGIIKAVSFFFMMYFKVKGKMVLIGVFIGLIIGASFLRMFWEPGFEEPQEETICLEDCVVIELDQSDVLYAYSLWRVPQEYRFEKVMLIIPK